MAEINRQDVREIFNTVNSETANEYLKFGWALLDTFKSCYDPEIFPLQQELNYVLVWVKDSEPVKPKSELDNIDFKKFEYHPEKDNT